jgi:hypothetical protein
MVCTAGINCTSATLTIHITAAMDANGGVANSLPDYLGGPQAHNGGYPSDGSAGAGAGAGGDASGGYNGGAGSGAGAGAGDSAGGGYNGGAGAGGDYSGGAEGGAGGSAGGDTSGGYNGGASAGGGYNGGAGADYEFPGPIPAAGYAVHMCLCVPYKH